MALKDTWTNKTDRVNDIVAEDINSVAQAVISIEDKVDTFVVNVTIGEDGTVTADKNGLEIAQAYKEQCGKEIDKKKIILPEAIKSFGVYEVGVKLHPSVTGKLKVKVSEMT